MHLLLLFHANGMSKGTYRPCVHDMAALLGAECCTGANIAGCPPLPDRADWECYQLGASHVVILVDMLGHGDADPLPTHEAVPSGDKSAVFTDQAAHLSQVVVQAVAAVRPISTSIVGHSLGGGAAVISLLDGSCPRVDHLVLFEPMYIFKPGLRDLPSSPMVRQTLRRRAVWPDATAARQYLLSKQLYSCWDPRALDGYLDDAFVQKQQLELKCVPATEAAVFSSGITSELYEKLQSTNDSALRDCSCVHVLYGDAPNALWNESAATEVFKSLSNLSTSRMHGGHLFPLENPKRFAEEVLLRVGWSLSTTSRL